MKEVVRQQMLKALEAVGEVTASAIGAREILVKANSLDPLPEGSRDVVQDLYSIQKTGERLARELAEILDPSRPKLTFLEHGEEEVLG